MPLDRIEYQLQSQTTPSSGKSINNLPTELLRLVFALYSDFDNGPVILLFVCRLWYDVVSEDSALWSYLRCNPSTNSAKIGQNKGYCPTFTNWEGMIKAAKRSGISPLSIFFANLPQGSPSEEVQEVFRRCKRLYIHYRVPKSGYELYSGLPELPALEELELPVDNSEGADLCHRIYYVPQFLERVRHLALQHHVVSASELQFHKSLTQLESLTLSVAGFTRSVPTLPRLTTFTIDKTDIGTSGDSQVELPALEYLNLLGNWANVQCLAAPRLKKLALISGREQREPYMPFLRRTTICPTSLVISNDIYERDISELLRGTWSNLQYLHWKSLKNGNSGPTAVCGVLAGDDAHPPACPQLRQFTVDIEANKSPTDIGPLVATMRNVVEERQSQGVGILESFKCVWSIQDNPTRLGANHLEWVDISLQ